MFKHLGVIFASLILTVSLSAAVFAEDVKIVRDYYGVPHIYAQTDEALMFGQGYAMASDRLFQMEICRLSASGEMAKYLGKQYLEYDRINRRYLPYGEQLLHIANNMDETQKALFKAFAAGVNYRIKEVLAAPDSKLSKEFKAFHLEPREWSFVDVVKIAMDRHKYLFDSDEELVNASLLAGFKSKYGEIDGSLIFDSIVMLNDSMATFVAPASPVFDKVSVGMALKNAKKDAAENRRVSAKFAVPYGMGSYAVVLFPKKSDTGNSMLLSGPQFGYTDPPFFYECGLHGKNIQAMGFQSVGLPGLSMGQNVDGAWTITGGLDNQLDYYVENLNPANKSQYWNGTSWSELKKETCIIDIKGDKTDFFDVYTTVHGPVVSIDRSNEKYPVAYAKKCSVTPKDMVSSWMNLFNILKAKSADDFIKAVKDYPVSTNFFYINRRQSPVFFHAGKYPVRPSTVDTRLPVDGRGDAEWSGFVPSDKLPMARESVRGYYADWNSKPSINWNNGEKCIYWGAQNRIDHVKSFIDSPVERKFSFLDLNEIDRKITNSDIYASDLKRLLVEAVAGSTDEDVKTAVTYLNAWNGEYTPLADGCFDAPGVAVFQTWLSEFVNEVCPELTGEYSRYAMNSYGAPLVYRIMSRSNIPYDFLKGKDLSALCESTLKKAVSSLKTRNGVEPSSWRMKINYTSFTLANPVEPGKQPAPSAFESFYAGNRASAVLMWEADRFWMKGVSVLPPGQGAYALGSEFLNAKDHRGDQMELYMSRRYKTALFYEEDVLHQAESLKMLKYNQ